jgi:ribonuclease HII
MREQLFPRICAVAHIAVGIVDVAVIDDINIYHATHAAMAEAVGKLAVSPAAVLIDGNRCPKLDVPAQYLIGGDCVSIAVAAASIIAKVTRDGIMRELSLRFPVYGWERNKGYGTREHAVALSAHGVSDQHRRSFRPIWERALEVLSA